MANYTIKGTGQSVDLNKNNFVTSGGEGNIHIIGNTVYKITKPAKMIPDGKIKELSQITTAHIITPKDIILKDKKAYGYTMKAVPSQSIPLAKILPKGYRNREGISSQHMVDMVGKMIKEIAHIHSKKGFLQVDGNELNYMVTKDHKSVYFIDVNSYQTPHYPANAIMSSIRDWSTNDLSQLTDAWSFAIISFYMFTAIHPFKGRHPDFANSKQLMIDNMTNHKSVLDKKTIFPHGPIYYPFENYVPGGKNGAFWQWYQALFVKGERHPIPVGFQGQINVVAHKPTVIRSSDGLKITKIKKYDSSIVAYYNCAGQVVITKNNIYHNGRPFKRITTNIPKIGATTFSTVIASYTDNGYFATQNLEINAKYHIHNVFCDNMMAYKSLVYIQDHGHIYEVQYIESTDRKAVFKPVATIMPMATKMFDGVVVQNMFDTIQISVFPNEGVHRQVSIPELNKYKIVDAKYDSKVLMVVGFNRDKKCYDRLVFRFSPNWKTYDCRKIADVPISILNFTVNNKGICVCINEEDKLEVFLNQEDNLLLKIIESANIKQDMCLYSVDHEIQFTHGDTLYSLTMDGK